MHIHHRLLLSTLVGFSLIGLAAAPAHADDSFTVQASSTCYERTETSCQPVRVTAANNSDRAVWTSFLTIVEIYSVDSGELIFSDEAQVLGEMGLLAPGESREYVWDQIDLNTGEPVPPGLYLGVFDYVSDGHPPYYVGTIQDTFEILPEGESCLTPVEEISWGELKELMSK